MVADRAKVPPWELEDAPSWWVDRILIALQAENRADEERQIRADRKARMQRPAGGGSLGGRR